MADPVWLDLFDTNYAENVCEQLRESMRPPLSSTQHLASWRLASRQYLLPELEAYINDHKPTTGDVEAALKLYQFAEELIEKIEVLLDTPEEFRDGLLWPTDPDELEKLWTTFIARGAGYRIWQDLPAERASKSKGGKISGERAERKADLRHSNDLDAAAESLNRLRAVNDVPKYSLKAIAAESGLTYRRVRTLKRGPIQARADELAK